MTELLIVHDGGDPSAQLLAAAGRRLGWTVDDADLRVDRFELTVGASGSVVRLRGLEVQPRLVLNRSSVTGLGLAGPAALRRQRGAAWRERHAAAREEQALLLAVLDGFERAGAEVVNAATAADLALMPNAVTERLHRRGVRVVRRDTEHLEVLVAAGRGVAYRSLDATERIATQRHLDLATVVAEAAGCSVTAVRFVDEGEASAVSGWDHRPDLLAWPDPDHCALGLLLQLGGVDRPALVVPAPTFFVDELGRPTTD
ncbi:MAG: hypothetical protein AAFZ07_11825 [Actinomycetota bacterium]